MDIIHLAFPFDLETQGRKQVLAIGDFDGVHLGHQDVISKAVKAGNEAGVPVSVMSFHPHPREVLGQPKYASYITPLEEKMRIFESLGVDYAYVVNFTEAFAQVTPEQFIDKMLIPMNLHSIIVGFDFAFGHRGAGTVSMLRERCEPGIQVETVAPFLYKELKVSSTRVREALDGGLVQETADLLGRPYAVSGTVNGGDKRGRTLGFPTANLQLELPFVVPARGVYAVRAYLGDEVLGGVMNIGVKPTFTNNTVPSLEVHLFDFDREIYGETLRVDFLAFIRSERKFNSVQEIIEQIHKDAAEAKSFYF
ncbi:bifunctional riboflavin kinase/FAD synthetase [Paenibacillus swuensis]|uniref:bifunctional riboflavin kinase/FAD synthetase n=1 Tax=Paenibacillus swuensis TaxID=1178515 RepID=UPI0009EEDA90|nr:bifunctional riboflavin kinase/FAD synthetase [Paenibacillus swuensis]